MSKVRFSPAAPINLIRLAIALAAVMATMAAMASSALAADSHSSECSGVGNCNSVIYLDKNAVNIELKGISLLDNATLVALKNVAIASNNTVACNQIITVLSVTCSQAIANGVFAAIHASVKDIIVTILGGKFPYHKHVWG